MIYGHIVCQDAMPDILRTIESIFPVCDEIMIVDGESQDGTWEFLNERSEIYNLKLFQRPFDTVQKQRQYLLNLTPKDSWIVALDQDEKLSVDLTKVLKDILLNENPQDFKREYPFVCKVAHYTLVNDLFHYLADYYAENSAKIFYYDRDLYWKGEFHSTPQYPDTEERVSGILLNSPNWAVIHYAWLDPKRMKQRRKKNFENYAKSEWDLSTKKIELLPKGVL